MYVYHSSLITKFKHQSRVSTIRPLGLLCDFFRKLTRLTKKSHNNGLKITPCIIAAELLGRRLA